MSVIRGILLLKLIEFSNFKEDKKFDDILLFIRSSNSDKSISKSNFNKLTNLCLQSEIV